MTEEEMLSFENLKSNYCFEVVDSVPRDPVTTAFKRRARLHQSLWRMNKGIEIGTEPIHPKPDKNSRLLGSRIAYKTAMETHANFLSEDIRCAVNDRIDNPERDQTIKKDRLYCDLLSSMPMCFNLFGLLYTDITLADRAVHAWWPDVPGRVVEVKFEWSPGKRLSGEYLENKSAFDVAFILEMEGGARGILGVETKYHEHCRREKVPSENRLKRYSEVTTRSGLYFPGATEAIVGSDLQQIWLDHLLALSMLQHPTSPWAWAGFVLVHPAKNPSYSNVAQRYRALLLDTTSFRTTTIESLLSAKVLPTEYTSLFSERYLW